MVQFAVISSSNLKDGYKDILKHGYDFIDCKHTCLINFIMHLKTLKSVKN